MGIFDLGGEPGRVIGCLYAWVVVDATGLESIIVGFGTSIIEMESVTSSLKIAKSMEPKMREISKLIGMKIKLQKFIFAGTVAAVGDEN